MRGIALCEIMAMDRETLCRIGMYGAAVLVGATTSAITVPTTVTIAGTSLAGVIGGMLANDLGALNDAHYLNRSPDLRNAHLTRATGRAIAAIIKKVAQEAQGGRGKDFLVVLKALADTAEKDWEAISQEILKQDNLAALDEKQLAEQYFSTAAPDFDSLRALAKAEDWLPVLEKLREKAKGRLKKGYRAFLWEIDTQDFDYLALELHDLFPKAIREELKKDFAQGKEAFAGMIFDLLGNLTQEVKAIRNSSEISPAEADKLDAVLEQLQQYENRDDEKFKELAKQVDSALDRITQELAYIFEDINAKIQEEHEKTCETVRQGHQETQETVVREADRIIDEFRQIKPKPQISAHPPTNLLTYRRAVAKFVGRDVAMSELSELLQDSETVAIAAAVSGMGGLGKTELAWQWASQQYQQGNFPGGVVWLDMAAGNPGEQLLLFCQTEFAVELPDFPTVAERIAYCWQHWAEWRAGKVLIVLDDVARDRDIEKLKWFQPGNSQFRVLWTTRENWTGIKRYPLDKLSEAAAWELLASYLDEKRLQDEPEAVAQLLAWFEGLPLGLELAARYLVLDEFLPIADYVRELSLAHESLENNREMPYPHGVEAALALSWGRLQDAEARVLALRLGLYGAAPIPLTDEQQKAWRKPLKELVNLSLLEREAADLVRLHPLVRQFFQAQLTVELSLEDVDELRREVAGVIVEQGKQIPYRFTMAQAREFAPWIPHLEEVAEVLLSWVVDEDVVEPGKRIAWYYQGQGLYSSAEPWSEQCLAVARERLGNQHPNTATALNCLANLSASQGRYAEAELLYKEALAIKQESLPSNHPDLASGINNLAALYASQGKYAEAEPLYLEAIAIKRESLPPNHTKLSTSLSNLAALYRYQGKYAEAKPLCLEAIAIDRKILPLNHPLLARHLNNLAELYRSQEKYNEAEPLYSEAIAIDRRTARYFNFSALLFSKILCFNVRHGKSLFVPILPNPRTRVAFAANLGLCQIGVQQSTP